MWVKSIARYQTLFCGGKSTINHKIAGGQTHFIGGQTAKRVDLYYISLVIHFVCARTYTFTTCNRKRNKKISAKSDFAMQT